MRALTPAGITLSLIHIFSSTGKAVLGDSYTFTAKLGGKHLTADSIRWYANGAEVPQAAGKTTVLSLIHI